MGEVNMSASMKQQLNILNKKIDFLKKKKGFSKKFAANENMSIILLPELIQSFEKLYEALKKEESSFNSSYFIITKYFSSLADKLYKDEVTTPENIKKFMDQLDCALFGEEPISPGVRAAIVSILFCVGVGLATGGLGFGAAVLALKASLTLSNFVTHVLPVCMFAFMGGAGVGYISLFAGSKASLIETLCKWEKDRWPEEMREQKQKTKQKWQDKANKVEISENVQTCAKAVKDNVIAFCKSNFFKMNENWSEIDEKNIKSSYANKSVKSLF